MSNSKASLLDLFRANGNAETKNKHVIKTTPNRYTIPKEPWMTGMIEIGIIKSKCQNICRIVLLPSGSSTGSIFKFASSHQGAS